MAELIEASTAAILVALAGILLWLITQIHLRKAVEAIRVDIDAKRTETMTFVDERLGKVEGLMGKHQALLTAQIPPNVHGELEEVRAEIEQINVGLRKEFEELPFRIQAKMMAENSARVSEMMGAAQQLNAGLKGELAAVNASLPPEIQQMDIRAKVLKAIAREPTPKERKDMGMIGELIWTAGRAKLAEWVQGEGPPGTSVTYRVTSKSPYGL